MKRGFWISSLLVLVLIFLSANAQLAEQWRYKYGSTDANYIQQHNFTFATATGDGGYYLIDEVYMDDPYSYYDFAECSLLRVEEWPDDGWRAVWSRSIGGGELGDLDVLSDGSLLVGGNTMYTNEFGYDSYFNYTYFTSSGQTRYTGNSSEYWNDGPWLGATRGYPRETNPHEGYCMFMAYSVDSNAWDYYTPANVDLYLKFFDEDGIVQRSRQWDLRRAWSGTLVPKIVNDAVVRSANEIYVYFRGKNFPFGHNPEDADYLVLLDADLNICWAAETPEFNPTYVALGETVSMQLTRDRSLLLQSSRGIAKYSPDGDQLWFTDLDGYVPNSVTIDIPTDPHIYYFVGYDSVNEDTPVLGALSEVGEILFVQEIPRVISASSIHVDGLYNVIVGGSVPAHDPYFHGDHRQAVLVGYGNTSSVLDGDSHESRRFTLHPVYPNPFNSTATISVDVAKPSLVNLSVFDVLGREVAVLREGWTVSPGAHQVAWDASNVAGGTYFLRASVGDDHQLQRLVLVK